jgi:hypothetical protein
MRRKLYLVNEVGSTFYFDYTHNCIIEELDGLGFEFDVEYSNFDANFVETKRKIPQKQINLNLIFIDGYIGFTRFREYVTKSKEIRLFYETVAGKKYCYINIVSSSKSQLESNILRSEVKVDCLSLWLVNKTAHIDVVDAGGGKIYSYSYPYVYAVSFNGKVTVYNDSPRDVPLLIRLYGNCYNPRVIIRQNGVDVQTLRLLVDERDEPLIEISSDPVNQYIKLIYGGEEIDYYDKQDFSCDNFLFLPPGESEIFFDPGVREEATCEIAYKEEYIAH